MVGSQEAVLFPRPAVPVTTGCAAPDSVTAVPVVVIMPVVVIAPGL